MGALAGIKVLDLSRVLAGPWCSQTLADLGAEVTKIERPDHGDDTRSWGPPFAPTQGDGPGESAYFLCANRGKRSVTLDLKTEQDRQRLLAMVDESDVLLENFKVGTLARLGLDYDTLAARNPRLVYCSITGFGQTGPYRDRPGYDFLIQAMGGLMSITGEADNNPGGGPQKIGVALTDIMTGLYASIGILAALQERERSGLGQYVDLALLDVTAATLANQATNYLVGGQLPRRLGNAHPNIVPYQAFRCADGHIIVTVGNDGQFQRFADVLHKAELAEDPRFATNSARVEHRDELLAIIEPLLAARDAGDWLRDFEAAAVPAGPINSVDQVFADPQIAARDMLITMEHADAGETRLVGNPIHLSRTPVTYTRPPPLLGEHND